MFYYYTAVYFNFWLGFSRNIYFAFLGTDLMIGNLKKIYYAFFSYGILREKGTFYLKLNCQCFKLIIPAAYTKLEMVVCNPSRQQSQSPL